MENVEIKVQEMDYSGTEAYKSLRTNLQFFGEDKKAYPDRAALKSAESCFREILFFGLRQSGQKRSFGESKEVFGDGESGKDDFRPLAQ